MLKIIKVIHVFVCFGFAYISNAQIKKTTMQKKMVQVLNEFSYKHFLKDDTSGFSIAIVLENDTFYFNQGLADIESKVPINKQTLFRMASVAKQFTGALILKLIEENKIHLETKLTDFFHGFHKSHDNITVADLIHHTSGLKDYVELWALMGYPENDLPTPKNVFQIIQRQKSLNFLSGSAYAYSNSNYFLLARIIEKVIGKKFHTITEEELFFPLKMNNTSFLYRDFDYSKLAKGYYYQEHFYPYSSRDYITGDGGLISNAEDISLWLKNYLSNSKFLNAMVSVPQPLNKLSNGYGYGLYKETINGLEIFKHGGIFAGYTHDVAIVPKKNFGVAILTNTTPHYNIEELTFNIIETICEVNLDQNKRVMKKHIRKANTTSSGNFLVNKNSLGSWYSIELQVTWKLFKKEEKLIVDFGDQKVEFVALGPNTYAYNDLGLKYNVEFDELILNTSRTKNIRFKRKK